MKDKKNREYFEVEVKELQIGSAIPFDCFIHLEKNQRALLWVRSGQAFTSNHQAKLSKSGVNHILVAQDQRANFDSYIKSHQSSAQSPIQNQASNQTLSQSTSAVTEAASTPHGQIQVQEKPAVAVANKSANTNKSNSTMIIRGARPESDMQIIRSKKPPNPGVLKIKVDVDFLNPFIQSTQQAFEQFCGAQIKFKPPSPRGQNQNMDGRFVVASLIGLVSESIRGNIGLCFTKESFLYTMSQMTGTPIQALTTDVIDGAGELMNFIFESARGPLIEQGYPLERAVPTLVSGTGMSSLYLITDPGFSIVFESPGGPFLFEVGIKTGG